MESRLLREKGRSPPVARPARCKCGDGAQKTTAPRTEYVKRSDSYSTTSSSQSVDLGLCHRHQLRSRYALEADHTTARQLQLSRFRHGPFPQLDGLRVHRRIPAYGASRRVARKAT